jgi:hypothetical protein
VADEGVYRNLRTGDLVSIEGPELTTP